MASANDPTPEETRVFRNSGWLERWKAALEKPLNTEELIEYRRNAEQAEGGDT